MTVELHQLESQVEIIGTLKELSLEKKVSKKGNNYIGGEIIVEVKDEDRINNIKVKVLVMESNKLFKGINTVYNEFIDEARARQSGRPQDRVQIIGNLEMNEWANDQGIITKNQIKGVFYNRVNDKPELADRAIARLTAIVEGFEDKVDSDNLPTGEKLISLTTVGYGPKVHVISKAFVGPELAQDFANLYYPGSMGKLNLKINNYALVEEGAQEKSLDQPVSHGFGAQVDVTPSTITKYEESLELIGGDLPMQEPQAYNAAQLEEVKRLRRLDLSKLEADTQPQNDQQQSTGFGNTGGFGSSAPTFGSGDDPFANNKAPIEVSEEDLPF